MADRVPVLDVIVPAVFYQTLKKYLSLLDGVDMSLVTQDMADALYEFLQEVVEKCISDTTLNPRTGITFNYLRDGVTVTSGQSVNDLHGYVLAPPYVAALEFGADIKPVHARVLCVPLPPALYPDGTPKRLAPRDWKSFNTFSYTSRRTGQGYLAYKDGDRLICLYVYVEEVKLKAQLGLGASYRELLPILLAAWEAILVSYSEGALAGVLEDIALGGAP